MRILIIGAGAMGSTFAGYLARAGHDVDVVDNSDAVVDAINQNGLAVTLPDGDTIRESITAHTDKANVPGPVDVIFVFVKSTATDAVARLLGKLDRPSLGVVTLQNGWGSADTLSSVVGGDRLLIGSSYNSAMVISPGEVSNTRCGRTIVGPFQKSAPTEFADKISMMLSNAGLETTASEDPGSEIWNKLVINAAIMPVSAVTGLRGGQIAEQPNALEVVESLAIEAVAVAQALGYDVDRAERIGTIHKMMSNAGMGKNSMLSDVEARRHTEIGAITGAIVREGLRKNVATPISSVMWNLVSALESGWRT